MIQHIRDATCIVISVCCISSGSPLDHLQLVDLVFVVPVPDSAAVLWCGVYNGAVCSTLIIVSPQRPLVGFFRNLSEMFPRGLVVPAKNGSGPLTNMAAGNHRWFSPLPHLWHNYCRNLVETLHMNSSQCLDDSGPSTNMAEWQPSLKWLSALYLTL